MLISRLIDDQSISWVIAANGSHHPARASKATTSKTADRVLGVHGFVIWRFVSPVEDRNRIPF